MDGSKIVLDGIIQMEGSVGSKLVVMNPALQRAGERLDVMTVNC